jgi:two-component system, LuxR family, sensor kinase FixL
MPGIERLFEGQSFRSVLESATDPMIIADQEGQILFSNAAMEQLLGYAPGEMPGLTVDDLLPAQFRKAHSAQRGQYAEQPHSGPIGELLALRKDGSELPVDISLSPLKTEHGLLIFATLHDVTRRKRGQERLAEQAARLQNSEARLRAILDTAFEGIVVLDEEGFIDSFSPGAERMFGYSEAEIKGLPFSALMPSPYREQEEARLARGIETGESEIKDQTQEIMGLRKNGTAFPMELGLTEMRLGQHRLFAGVLRDVTERREAQERQTGLLRELEIKNAELERFVYTVSHDLKSPLITIQGFSGMLEQSVAKGDSARILGDVKRIRAAAAKMQMLLDDLLELSRIGRLVNSPVQIPLEELANEAIELVAGQAASGKVQVNILPGLPTIIADRQRLLEVLQNLLDNAIKFMGGQSAPYVEIGAKEEGGETVCYVRDNGIGIDPRYYTKVFKLFERLDQTTEGTGIGLAIAKRIIDVHGGRIWVESKGLGYGSTFYFSIPAMKNSNTPKA